LRCTTKSTRHLARKLTRAGHVVSHSVVAKILKSAGYSLQSTRKTLEGAQKRDRDAQFRYLNTTAAAYLAAGDPVISIDTKKKELMGRSTRAGQQWHPTGGAERVETYDFPHLADGKAIPYGVSDLADNGLGVGRHRPRHVRVRRRHHHEMVGEDGPRQVPEARRLLITADCGGSRRRPSRSAGTTSTASRTTPSSQQPTNLCQSGS
jgi:hypothetical protein